MKILNKIADYDNPDSLANQFRHKRFRFFESLLGTLDKQIKILDVGGTQLFWETRGYNDKENIEITLLNLYEEKVSYDNFKSLAGDAIDLSMFEDNHFDIVFSNSVIEHLHTKDNQLSMANEVMRVGKHYFIQTPNRHFPIEPHFLFPFFQYLPKSLKIFLFTKTKLIRGKKYSREHAEGQVQEIRLISFKEYRRLFPESNIYRERFMGLTKSFTAHNFSV